MPGLAQTQWEHRGQGTLSDYVTAIAWSPQGTTLAIATAAGDIHLINPTTQAEQHLQGTLDQSIDGLAFSADGRYLAAVGQAGQVLIWRSPPIPTATPDPSPP
ncbi:MAG: hypothetical protein VKJ09_04345, partial [Leptolyngbya sp.]|nr:hypothetical protein [Leptolyngbya sp.]